MKALITIGTGPMYEVLELTKPTFQRFADKHGYQLHTGSAAWAEGRPVSWGKVAMFQSYLRDHDEVLWLDADCLVVDDSEDVPIREGYFQSMGSGGCGPNAGVWKVRNTPKTHAFLSAVWDMTQYTDHQWWEQAAILELLGYHVEGAPRWKACTAWRRYTYLLPTEWDSVCQVDDVENPRIRHFAGKPNDERLKIIRAEMASHHPRSL